ncbi:ENDO3c domain-containing protein [Psidium guajava]|nr:ENDO3c domain-containing protein [Psidium guajava]
MGIGNAVEIDSKGRDSWEPITPEKVNKLYVRRQSKDNHSGCNSSVRDAARIGANSIEDVREKEPSPNVAGLSIDVNQDARNFACFDANSRADLFKHVYRRREVSEAARDKGVRFADRGAFGSSDGSGFLESNLAAPMAGQQSVELLYSAHRGSTPVFNTNIPPSNVDHQGVISSFEAISEKPTDPVVTSTPMQIPNAKVGINLNKTKRQKPKKKKHTPKVIREGRPRQTPKRKEFGSETPSAKKRKHAREKNGKDSRPSPGDINDAAPAKGQPSFEPPHVHKLGDSDIPSKFVMEKKIGQGFQPEVKSCRRHLDFGTNHAEDGKVADQLYGNDTLVGTGLVQSQRDTFVADQTSSQVLPSSTCKRVNRKSQCLDGIRRIGHSFPIKFKKKRTGRRKRTAATKMTYMLFVLCPRGFYVSYPRDSKKKRTMRRNPNRFRSTVEAQKLEIPATHHALVSADEIGVKSEAGHFAKIDQQTSDGTKVKGREKRKRRLKGPEKYKGAKPKLQQELERIIQKIMDLNIGDISYKSKMKKKPLSTQGILICYEPKAKKKAPRVELDPETVKRWELLIVSDNGGPGDEADDKDTDGKWAWEREVFRGRVESLLALMHLILGDRHFTFWKGSVVDSIIGVYLTQNVSDYLSSNAFMSLASKFPLYPVKGEENGDGEIADVQETIGSDVEPIGPRCSSGDDNPIDIQVDQMQELHDILKQILGKEETVSSQRDMKHEKGHAGRQASASGEKKKKVKVKEKKTDPLEWEELRRLYSSVGPRIADHMDSVDWDAVRRAKPEEVAEAIQARGQHRILAKRIQHFLNELVRKQGSIDLEWLRNCPPGKAKEYLLEIPGLGLKSVECVRLLALQHVAFPVDTNVGRIAVRLGWVPLEPLPENLQIHLLEKFPVMDEIQKYLWPRLRELDQRTLYELHYHLITFGKVFCTKTKPNCNACPMRGECKHYASAYASARLSLPAPKAAKDPATNGENAIVLLNGESTAALGTTPLLESGYQTGSCEPIIEEPESPKVASKQLLERDIEDFYCDDGDEIPTIKLSSANFSTDLQSPIYDVGMFEENSRALVALNDFIPLPKLKEVTRLRTEHHVYELPDSHPLLRELPMREVDDPCPYLLLIWTEEEAAASPKSPNGACDSRLATEACNEQTCREESCATIKGTLLIPCRTSLRARFPLNGTYFQVNEVFADHESSHNPISVPRRWIWNLPRRMVYFGTSASSIFKGLTMGKIQSCFRNGFICVRGIDRKTGAPRPLILRFHRQPNKPLKAKRET